MEHFPFEEKNFLGNRLRELRLAFGFKQEDIAKTLNVSRSTYSYYETGVTRPDPAVLGKLSAYYRIPVEAFYDVAPILDIPLSDPMGRRRRTPRSSALNPQKIAELQPVERSLILFLRSNGRVNAKEVLEYLEARLAEERAKEQVAEEA